MVGAEGQKSLNFQHAETPKMAFLREKLGILSLVGTKSGGKSYLRVKARGPLDRRKSWDPRPWPLCPPIKPPLIWGPKMPQRDEIIITHQENWIKSWKLAPRLISTWEIWWWSRNFKKVIISSHLWRYIRVTSGGFKMTQCGQILIIRHKNWTYSWNYYTYWIFLNFDLTVRFPMCKLVYVPISNF